MYAIIRTGGKQAKVREGDVIDVERLRAEGEVTFTPLLFVGDDGTVISDRDGLKEVRVVGKILGGSAGPKVDIFKYKSKTGYRRRQGHRQKYTTVEVTAIEAPGVQRAEKAAEPESAAKAESAATAESAAKAEAAEEKPAAKKPSGSKASAASGSKATGAKTPAKDEPKAKQATKSTTTKKAAPKKPAPKKES